MSDDDIDDTNNILDRSKRNSIANKREKLDEWEERLSAQHKFGEISREVMESLMHDRVRAYLIAIEPVMLYKEADELYNEEYLGEVTIPVPEPWNAPNQNGIEYKSTPPQPRSVEIRGVSSVIENEGVGANWEKQVRIEGSDDPRQTVRFSNKALLGMDVLRTAYRKTELWLQEENLSIKLDLEDDMPTYGFKELSDEEEEEE